MKLDEKIISSASDILGLKSSAGLQITPLTGDASSRSYFRLKRNEKSFILMKMESGFNSPAEEITKSLKKIDELPFLNIHRFLSEAKVPVPEIFGFDPDAGIIVLEDLGDISLFSALTDLNKNETEQFYEKLILELVKFQSAGEPSFPCIAFYRKYDEEMCRWELDHFSQWGIESFLERKMTAKESDIIGSFYNKIVREFLDEKFCFTHRDYHSKNVMIQGRDLHIIDFQDALLAPAQYDLASLLRDSYTRLDEGLIGKLIKTYIKEWEKVTGEKIDNDKFTRAFDFVSMHRNLKAAGRFVFIEKKKGNSSYIRYIPETLRKVKINLIKYDDFKDVRDVLLKYINMIEEKINSRARS